MSITYNNMDEGRDYFWITLDDKMVDVGEGETWTQILPETFSWIDGMKYPMPEVQDAADQARAGIRREWTQRDKLGADFAVDPADERTLRLGYGWDAVRVHRERLPRWWRYGGTGYKRARNGLRLTAPTQQRQEETAPGMLRLLPSGEKRMCAYIRDHFIEGVLEVPAAAFEHWARRKAICGDAKAAAGRLRGANAEQRREGIRDVVAPWVTEATTNSGKLAMAWVDLRGELATKFRGAGNSLEKTLAVCARYVKGELGVDWHLRGFFDPERTPTLAAAERRTIDAHNEVLRRHRDGDPHTHFGTDALAPLFKSRPELARAYNIPS